MDTKTISMCQGKGSLTHNNRIFTAKNIDKNRTENNIVFVREDLKTAYEKLFDDAVTRYNAAQKRSDRKISDYFEHLFGRKPTANVITGANKQKSFYEDLVQIGTKDDTGVGLAGSETAIECLKEYMNGFQQRNPNFYVFNAVMHLDEATPHLHIDYIPVGHFDKGLDTRNAMAKALKEMGFGNGKDAINRWRKSEWRVLHDICLKHGIQISEPKKSRGYSYTVEEYKEHQDRIHALESEKEQICSELAETREQLSKVMQKKSRIAEIDEIPVKKSVFGNKVTLSQEDYENIQALAEKQIAGAKSTKKLKSENTELLRKVDSMEAEIQKLSSELEEYHKPVTFSREKLKQEAQKISELEQLRSKYRKAIEFIQVSGLQSEYERYQQNHLKRKSTLE